MVGSVKVADVVQAASKHTSREVTPSYQFLVELWMEREISRDLQGCMVAALNRLK